MDIRFFTQDQWEDYMNAQRQTELLRGESSTSRKVFEFVPIEQTWTSREIISALRNATRTVPDVRIVEGALRSMVESGLIKEPTPGRFQRKAVRMPDPHPPAPIAVVREVGVSPVAAELVRPAEPDPMDLLTDIAGRLAGIQRELEEATIAIAQKFMASEKDAAKFAQLQAIFKP